MGENLSQLLDHQKQFGATLVVILAAFLLMWGIRAASIHIADPASRRFIEQTFRYVIILVTIGAIIKVWLQAFNLGAFLGLTAAGMALALKDPIASFAGWLFILLRHPFRVGDRIQLGTGMSGDVTDIRPFTFTILEIGNWIDADQFTGRIVHMPNAVVFTSSVANYTAEFPAIWNELTLHLTYDSDWQRAIIRLREILLHMAQDTNNPYVLDAARLSSAYQDLFHDQQPGVWMSVAAYGVRLSLRYVCDPRQRRASSMAVWSEVLTMLQREPNISLAYPTQRFYDHALEGPAAQSRNDNAAPSPGA